MDISRSAPQGAHYHEDVIYLLSKLGRKKGPRALWYSEFSVHQLGSLQHTLAFYIKCMPPVDLSNPRKCFESG